MIGPLAYLAHDLEEALGSDRSNRILREPAPGYLIAFIYPITATLRTFLEKKGHSPEQVEKMQDAWRKSVVLQVVLWSQPYIVAGDF